MALSIHTLTPGKRTQKPARRVGRGNSTQKGTTAGKGTKGQKARSGARGGLKLKGFRQSLLKVPKVRGFKSNKPRPETVSLATLERVCQGGEVVTPYWLHKKGLVPSVANGVKILRTGELTKKITVEGCIASKGAVAAIEKAGGVLVF